MKLNFVKEIAIMKIVVLDGYTENPGDLSWDALKQYGTVTVYDRTPRNELQERARQADIAVLNRTSPIWVSLFALLILRERISKVQIPVILLCLAGAVAAMRPSFDSNTLPLVLALLTAVSSGLAYTMIAFCRGQVAPMTVIFHFSLFSTIAAGFLMIPSFVVPTPRDLIMLILIGIFGAGGQIGLTYAYQKAPAAEVSIYDYSGIIFSAILGYVLLGESLSLSTIVGAALITAGGLWSYCANRKQAGADW